MEKKTKKLVAIGGGGVRVLILCYDKIVVKNGVRLARALLGKDSRTGCLRALRNLDKPCRLREYFNARLLSVPGIESILPKKGAHTHKIDPSQKKNKKMG